MCCPPSCSARGRDEGPGKGSLLVAGLGNYKSDKPGNQWLITKPAANTKTRIRVLILPQLDPRQDLGRVAGPGGDRALHQHDEEYGDSCVGHPGLTHILGTWWAALLCVRHSGEVKVVVWLYASVVWTKINLNSSVRKIFFCWVPCGLWIWSGCDSAPSQPHQVAAHWEK